MEEEWIEEEIIEPTPSVENPAKVSMIIIRIAGYLLIAGALIFALSGYFTAYFYYLIPAALFTLIITEGLLALLVS